jgi:hypothetical protein
MTTFVPPVGGADCHHRADQLAKKRRVVCQNAIILPFEELAR